MTYQHDVFISYKREANWTPWTRDHFKSLLQSYLQQDLGHLPDIFIDERIESEIGEDWVQSLGKHLATSRVAVVVFSGDYFSSDWCIHELDLMLERVEKCHFAAHAAGRLIIPVIGHDGELIPDPIARMTAADIRKYRIAWINKDTLDYHEFSKLMREFSPKIAKAINEAPAFEDDWIPQCVNRFEAVYEAQQKGRRLPPSKFVLKAASSPLAPPRLVI